MTAPAKQEWDTAQLQEDFEVKSFCYGIVFVTRKKDNRHGTMDFDHRPRRYYNFVADD